MAFCADACWPKATSQFALMRCHLCALGRKRDFIETILLIIIFLTLLSETIQENRKNHHSFVGSCLVSTVSRHVRSTQKEHINDRKVAAERVVELQRRGSCRAEDPARVGIA